MKKIQAGNSRVTEPFYVLYIWQLVPVAFPSVLLGLYTRFILENTVGVLENLSFQTSLFKGGMTLITHSLNSKGYHNLRETSELEIWLITFLMFFIHAMARSSFETSVSHSFALSLSACVCVCLLRVWSIDWMTYKTYIDKRAHISEHFQIELV